MQVMQSSTIQPGTPEHRQALGSLGLPLDSFTEIGTRILAAFNQATPNDAANAAGSYAYFAAVRALRDGLCSLGWESYTKHNLEMVVSPERQMAIIVSSGDKNTGLNGQEAPKTKNQKGNKTREIVASNQIQMYLFSEMEPPQPIYDQEAITTWFLLYHVDLINSEMRMELSLPVNMDLTDLRVDRWSRRINLSSINFDPIPTVHTDGSKTEFEIEIRRKHNE